MRKGTYVLTRKVRLSYAHVWEPVEDSNGNSKYQTAIIIPKDDYATRIDLYLAVLDAHEKGQEKYGNKFAKLPRIPAYPDTKSVEALKQYCEELEKIVATITSPINDGDKKDPKDSAYENSIYLNAKSNRKPEIVDSNREPIYAKDEVYSGCYCVVSLNFYPYNISTKRGVACGLGNLMKVADGEPLTGRTTAKDDFANVNSDDLL